MERSLVSAVLVVSALLTAAFLLVREGSGLLLAAGAVIGLAGLLGLVRLVRVVALDARREVRR